ncbi:MAG: quinoprotein dehydrogenase-associated SoxYZ-like carrier [Steroidobacteraceae bacterium]|jgi:sulfur-oxidizing protein SoxY
MKRAHGHAARAAIESKARRRLACAVALCTVSLGIVDGVLAEEDSQPSGSAWQLLRAKYYGDQSMGLVDENYMSLEVPGNTPDPASTPLTLRFSDDGGRRVKRVRVFVDNNPSPLVATFDFARTPITEIDMHVRIDRFTSVRVVAETSDGSLEMRSAWVKASGGCSAPPTDSSQGGVLGQIKLRPAADDKSILVSIRHPNSSGFQIDPRTGDSIPARYISHILIKAGEAPLLEVESGISVSENPTFRVASDQSLLLPVSIDAVDSVSQAHYIGSTQTTNPSASAARTGSAMNGGYR